MAIDAIADRSQAAGNREDARIAAHYQSLGKAFARRDQRVEEAQKSAAARPTPAERGAQAPARRSATRVVDVLA